MTYTEKRLEEFDEKFLIPMYGDESLGGNYEAVKAFLAESINQALAEERERVRGIIDWELTPHGYESDDPQFERFAIKIKEKYKNKIRASLDKP